MKISNKIISSWNNSIFVKKSFNPFPSLPSFTTDDGKQIQCLIIVLNNKTGPLFLKFNNLMWRQGLAFKKMASSMVPFKDQLLVFPWHQNHEIRERDIWLCEACTLWLPLVHCDYSWIHRIHCFSGRGGALGSGLSLYGGEA